MQFYYSLLFIIHTQIHWIKNLALCYIQLTHYLVLLYLWKGKNTIFFNYIIIISALVMWLPLNIQMWKINENRIQLLCYSYMLNKWFQQPTLNWETLYLICSLKHITFKYWDTELRKSTSLVLRKSVFISVVLTSAELHGVN